ncbi:Mak10 subunit, NatC N-terminal acetyltransferase-domain-containing protein [Coprinopsis sp. MPI-PUGE-AT-0042]|nr:Mak10 subunit, NatC N-terminal acetyltransferase-domain-containing protein [Coprinopsis sp. MPI-PUGE-AT-0042]
MDFAMDYGGQFELDDPMDEYQDYVGPSLAAPPDVTFEDVTAIFRDAASEIDPETILFMDGFGLQDAMSAFEGKPRLDTGFIGDKPPVDFNPLEPLLPEEVCWILDTALGYELEWHDGKLLPHTVFTLQYVHHLRDIEPELTPWQLFTKVDPERPPELITVVLGACVVGLIKCVDLAWLEMHNNELVQDAEDWQSDKCELALLEALPAQFVVQRLDDAISWIKNSGKVPEKWKDALISRVALRKALVELLQIDPSQHRLAYHSVLSRAKSIQYLLSSNPTPEPSPASPARNAFDPCISRRLNTCVPVRVIPTPSSERISALLGTFLEGLEEAALLAGEPSLATWETVGKMRVWLNDAPRYAYVRSLTQSCFYNGLLILNQHPFSWALDKLFEERIGLSWKRIREYVDSVWATDKDKPSPIIQIERRMYKLLISHIKLHWSNLSRMRRKLAKLVVEWHYVYDLCIKLVEGISDKLPTTHLIRLLPSTVLTIRLESIRDIVMSGFQLELYAPHEKPFAYWYLTSTLEKAKGTVRHHNSISTFRHVAVYSTQAKDTQFKSHLSSALCSASKGFLFLTLPMLSKVDTEALRPGFYKRYKWAFRPDYGQIQAGPVGHPDLEGFLEFCEEVIEEQESGDGVVEINPGAEIERAKTALDDMMERAIISPWVKGKWGEDMKKALKAVEAVCSQSLSAEIPTSGKELELFDVKRLSWDPKAQPWFPSVGRVQTGHLKRSDMYREMFCGAKPDMRHSAAKLESDEQEASRANIRAAKDDLEAR